MSLAFERSYTLQASYSVPETYSRKHIRSHQNNNLPNPYLHRRQSTSSYPPDKNHHPPATNNRRRLSSTGLQMRSSYFPRPSQRPGQRPLSVFLSYVFLLSL